MSKRIALAVTLLALSAGSAGAGGFATAGVAPPPDGIETGQTWDARIEIKQHGVTPLAGLEPTLTIRQGSTAKTFPTDPTDRVGVYVAHVKFPSAGEWSYEVMDGFAGATHTFAPVAVAAGTSGDDGLGRWGLVLMIGAALLLAGAAFFFVAQRSGRPEPAAS